MADDFDRELRELNELRRTFWSRYRELRNKFLSLYPPDKHGDDPEWQEQFEKIEDLALPCSAEEIWRQHGGPARPRTYRHESDLTPEQEEALFDHAYAAKWHEKQAKLIADGPREKRRAGLFESDRLCPVCGLPFSGRADKQYCSDSCKAKAKSRRWRKANPEKKRKSEYKYLSDTLEEEQE